jgi:hypothetical protein
LWCGQFLHYHTTEAYHTWSTQIMESTWQPNMCCPTMLNLHQVFMILAFSPLSYNLGSPYLVHTLMMEGTCLYVSKCHLTKFSYIVLTIVDIFSGEKTLHKLFAGADERDIDVSILLCCHYFTITFNNWYMYDHIRKYLWSQIRKVFDCIGGDIANTCWCLSNTNTKHTAYLYHFTFGEREKRWIFSVDNFKKI